MFRIRIHRIHIVLGLPDPDPLVRGTVWVRIRILLSTSKNSKKNLDSYCSVLWLLLNFLSLKKYVNVPSKSNKQKNILTKFVFCCRLEGQ
jgi:hypothetical protein